MTPLAVAKVSLLLLGALLALYALRRSSPSVRHVVVLTGLTLAITVPALESALPSWRVLPPIGKVTPAAAADVREISAGRDGSQANMPASARWAPIRVDEIGLERINPVQLLRLAWKAGFAALLIALLSQVLAMELTVRRARVLSSPRWNRVLDDIRCTLGLRERVEIRLRAAHTMPAVWGIRRPTILLPRSCLRWSDERRRAVLAHELAHIARRDTVALVIGQLACAVHWFNPLVWMLRNRLAAEREQACDDIAINHATHPSCYAAHLLATAADCQEQRTFAPLMAGRSQLERRIMAILDKNRSHYNVRGGRQFAFTAIAALMLLPLSALSWADEHDPSSVVSEVALTQSDGLAFRHHLATLRIDEQDIDALLTGLSAPSPLTRAASAWALSASADPVVVDPLIRAGYDPDSRVRQWAIRALAKWPLQSVVEMLVARLEDSDPEIRQWAVRSLGNRDLPPVVSKLLIARLNDADAEVREWAARALRDNDDAEAKSAIESRFAMESDPSVIEELTKSIDHADAVGSEYLFLALGSSSAEIRQWAVRGLYGNRDDRTTGALIAMLADDDPEVREWSVRSLAYCGNDRVVGALQRLDNDPDEDVREWVHRALEEIGCRPLQARTAID